MTIEQKREYERNWYKTIGAEKRKAANKKWEDKQVENYKEFKKTLKCSRCEETHPACLQFHHLDPNTKDGDISVMMRRVSLKKLKEEIEKCIILCANCHVKEHYKPDIV